MLYPKITYSIPPKLEEHIVLIERHRSLWNSLNSVRDSLKSAIETAIRSRLISGGGGFQVRKTVSLVWAGIVGLVVGDC